MDENIISLIAKELNISITQVKNTLELLEEGATVPFIARYRKERTKGLDEEQIRVIQENYAYQVNLAKRKEEVLARIETLGKLDDEIIKNVKACTKLSQVEDIYRPYNKRKRRVQVLRLPTVYSHWPILLCLFLVILKKQNWMLTSMKM